MHGLIAKSSVTPLNIFGLLMRLVRLGLKNIVNLSEKTVILLKIEESSMGETIHPTQKFTSMNLLQMSCVMT